MARLYQQAKWIATHHAGATSVTVLSVVFLLLAVLSSPSNSAAGKTGKDQISSSSPSSISSISPNVSTTTPNYTVTSSTGASIVPGDTDVGSHCDDCTTGIILPFPVILYDQVFTSANVSSNGNLQFNSNSARFSNDCLPDSSFSYTIFPYWDDLYTGGALNGQGVFTSISGTAPNRIFNIEWRAVHCCGIGAPNTYFEIRLYEGLRKFDLIYGSPLDNSDPNGIQYGGDGVTQTVGVQADDGTHFT